MKMPKWPIPSTNNKIEFGLERMKILLEKLGNPEKGIPPVFHIAGTNGKGSTTAFLKYMFEAQGYKVHRNTSPHLINFNERIEVCGEQITDEYYNELAKECKYVVEKHNLDSSFFEITTAIAFMAFSRNAADVTILEVGLGGRLDATNVVDNPLVSIITPISFDHMDKLGNTLELIALEKAKIIKQNCPVVIAKQEESVSKIFRTEAEKLSSAVFEYDVDWEYKNCLFKGFGREFKTPPPSLLGKHQLINAGTAIAAILCQNKIKISNEAISNGLKNTVWPGRIQKIENTNLNEYLQKPSELYLDGAHNEGGARTLGDWLMEEKTKNGGQNIIIISILERKDSLSYINNIKGAIDKVIAVNHTGNDEFITFKNGEVLKSEFENSGFKSVSVAESVQLALKMINDETGILKRIVICGSLYFIGNVSELIGV